MSLEFPLYFVKVEDLGVLFYPIIRIKLKTIFGWKTYNFLVDTGADVTTVPYPIALTLGVDVKKLPQAQTQGVGGISVATYRSSIAIMVGPDVFPITVSITKDNSTPPLLGKKDIFDRRYSLIVDSKNSKTILRKNYK